MEDCHKKVSKGDFVTFHIHDKSLSVIVTRGATGQNYANVDIIGSDEAYKVSACDLEVGVAPALPAVRTALQKWTVKAHKTFPEMSEETLAFKARIFKNDTHVFDVKNDGRGGCMELIGSHAEFKALTEDVTQACIEEFPDPNNRPNSTELEEVFINWLAMDRKLHSTFVETFQHFIFK